MTKTRSGMGKSGEDYENSSNKSKNGKLIDSETIYTIEAAVEEKTKEMAL